MSTISMMTTDTLVALLESPGSRTLVDVRERDEFELWRIAGACNIPLGQLADRLQEIPRDRPVVAICAAGLRAAKGAEILRAAGYEVAVLDGGMGAWGHTYDHVSLEVGGATVVQVRRRGKGCLSYVVGAGRRCVVIDPSIDLDVYRDIARERGWTIANVLDTHLHADHLSGARSLALDEGAELDLNPQDPFNYDFTALTDGFEIALAEGVALTVSAVTTPGHTEGSTMYRLGTSALFTGDTLFLESVGRPDLADQAEPFARSLFHSLHERVLPLDDDTLVLPAHYGDGVEVHAGELVSRQLGQLRRELSVLNMNEDDFVAWAVASVKDRPPNYVEIVRFNAGLSELDLEQLVSLEAGPNRCAIAR